MPLLQIEDIRTQKASFSEQISPGLQGKGERVRFSDVGDDEKQAAGIHLAASTQQDRKLLLESTKNTGEVVFHACVYKKHCDEDIILKMLRRSP